MKRVLDVGQCGADHWAIRRLIASHFEADVTGADDLEEALAQLRAGRFDLVLVNRKLDTDGSDGLEAIRRIKAEEAFAPIPVMLVTNYREYQEQAVAAGAEMGFGKAHLGARQTRALLEKFLG
jgi:two-component system, chemotaxis family, chemotaxis protein CheY